MNQVTKPNEIRLIRRYAAKRAEVWQAFTDSDQVSQWWGPRGFSLTHHSKDLRPGGHWRYTMHGPDGTDYPNHTLYHEVVTGERLVYDHGGNDHQAPLFRVTATFSDVSDQTELNLCFSFTSAAVAQDMARFIKDAGGNATWDRLAEFLGKRHHNKDIFVINRSFAADPQTVFTMWCDPRHLAQWLPPKGFAMEYLRSDIKEGLATFYCMSNDQGLEFFGRTHYLNIQPPQLLVMKQEFCDKDENLCRHPLAPEFPQAILSTVVFAAEGSGTRITLTSVSDTSATAIEIKRFLEERAGMTQGWSGSLDTLDGLL